MHVLVVGGANTVWDDIREAEACFSHDVVIAINDVGIHLPNVDHWVTMHPEKMGAWLKERRRNRYAVPRLWTAGHKLPNQSSIVFNYVWSRGGSSGMLAVRVARHLKAKKILLAGVPMMSHYAHFNNANGWVECDYYKRAWEREARNGAMNDVRSMSGWTKTLIGGPDPDWCGKRNPAISDRVKYSAPPQGEDP